LLLAVGSTAGFVLLIELAAKVAGLPLGAPLLPDSRNCLQRSSKIVEQGEVGCGRDDDDLQCELVHVIGYERHATGHPVRVIAPGEVVERLERELLAGGEIAHANERATQELHSAGTCSWRRTSAQVSLPG
jgi:hypothetical protein